MRLPEALLLALLLTACSSHKAAPPPAAAPAPASELPTITYEPWRPEPLNNSEAWATLARKEKEAHDKLAQIQGRCGDEIYRENTACHDVYGTTVDLIQRDLQLIDAKRKAGA
jgi:hypothetical protein